MSILGERLKKLRNQHKLTQGQLAERLGLVRGSYANYENGSREPDLEQIQKFANFYNISVQYLMGEEEEEDLQELINIYKSLKSKESREKFREWASATAKGLQTEDRPE